MIRPHIDITMYQGYLGKVYPPLQWGENTSQRKMLTDVREWLHNHHPSWQRAMVYFSHYRLGKTHTDTAQESNLHDVRKVSVLSGDREYRNQLGANVPQLH